MMVSMDRAGRIVIPKEARDRLDLDENTPLDLVVEGSSLRITLSRPQNRTFEVVDGLAVFPASGGPPFTDLDIQRLRDADQR